MENDTRWVRVRESCKGCEHNNAPEYVLEVKEYNREGMEISNKIKPNPLWDLILEHGIGKYTHCKLPTCYLDNE